MIFPITGELQEHVAAAGDAESPPLRERLLGSDDGSVDIVSVSVGDGQPILLGRWLNEPGWRLYVLKF